MHIKSLHCCQNNVAKELKLSCIVVSNGMTFRSSCKVSNWLKINNGGHEHHDI